jgi:hypothetical protein
MIPMFPALLALEEHIRHAFAMPLLWLQFRLLQRKDAVPDGARRRILAKYGAEWREAHEEARRTLDAFAAGGSSGTDILQTEMFVMWDFGWKYAERCFNNALAAAPHEERPGRQGQQRRTIKRIKAICEIDMFNRHKRRKNSALDATATTGENQQATMDEYSATSATVCM